MLIPAAVAQGKNLVPILPKINSPAHHSGKRKLLPLKNFQTRFTSTIPPSQVPSRHLCTSNTCTTTITCTTTTITCTTTTTTSSTDTATTSTSNNRPRIGRPTRAVKKVSSEMRFILPKTDALPHATFSSTVGSTSSTGDGLGSRYGKSHLLIDCNSGARVKSNKESHQFINTLQTFTSPVEVSAGMLFSSAGVPQRSNSSFGFSNSNLVQAKENLPVYVSRNANSDSTAESHLSAGNQEKRYLSCNGKNKISKSVSLVKSFAEANNSLGITQKDNEEVAPKKKLIIIKAITEEKTSLATTNRVSSVLTISRNTDRSAFTLAAPTLVGRAISSSVVRINASSVLTEVKSSSITVSSSNVYEEKTVDETQSSINIQNTSQSQVCTTKNTPSLKDDTSSAIQTPITCNLKRSGFSVSHRNSGSNTRISCPSSSNPISKSCLHKLVKNVSTPDSDLSMFGIEIDEPPHDLIINPSTYQKFPKNADMHHALSPALKSAKIKTIVINSNDVSPEPDVNVYTASNAEGCIKSLVETKSVDKSSLAAVGSYYNTTKIAGKSCLASKNSKKLNPFLLETVDGNRREAAVRRGTRSCSEDESSLEVPFTSALSECGGSSHSKGGFIRTGCAGEAKIPCSSDQPSVMEKRLYHLSSVMPSSAGTRQKKCSSEGQTMLCQVCGKLLRGPSSLRTHLLTHSTVKPHACSVCHKRFRRRVYLRYHMLTHTDERPYVCTFCSAAFRTKQRLTSHSLRHTVRKAEGVGYPCKFCPKVFETKHGLNSHSKQHSVKTPCSCKVCGKSFKSLTCLKLHNLAHKKPERLQHKCEVCGQLYVYRSLLKRHMETHSATEPKYSCQVCMQKFIWKSSMVSHYKTHVPKKYECKLCPLSFHSEVKLAAHLKKHSNPKPHSCTLCLKKFAFRYLLNKHIRRGHGHRNFYRVKAKKAVVDRVEINLPPSLPSAGAEESQSELVTVFPNRDENCSAVTSLASEGTARGALEPSLHNGHVHVNDLSVKSKDLDQFNMENPSKDDECIDHSSENNAVVNNNIINLSLLRPNRTNENDLSQTEQVMSLGSAQMCGRPENSAFLPKHLPHSNVSQMKRVSGYSMQIQKPPNHNIARTKRHPNVRKPPPAYYHSPHNLSLACPSRGENSLLFTDDHEVRETKLDRPTTSNMTSGRSPDTSSRGVFGSPDDGCGFSCAPHPNLMPASTDPYLESSYSESPCYLSPAGIANHNTVEAVALLEPQCPRDASVHGVHPGYDQHSPSVHHFNLYNNHDSLTSQHNQSQTSLHNQPHTSLHNQSHTPLHNQSHTPLHNQSHTPLHNQSHTPLHNQSHTPLYNQSHTPTTQHNQSHTPTTQHNQSHISTTQHNRSHTPYNKCDTPDYELNLNHNNHSTPTDPYKHNQHNTQSHYEVNQQLSENHGQFYLHYPPTNSSIQEFSSSYPNVGEMNPHLHALNVPPPRCIVHPPSGEVASETQGSSKFCTQSESSSSSVNGRGYTSGNSNFISTTPAHSSPMFGAVGFASPLDYPSPISAPSSAFLQTPSTGLTGCFSIMYSLLLRRRLSILDDLDADSLTVMQGFWLPLS
ncbi:Zinc finger C2H2-type [Trinorchestia longiramus]|nr:Zinc finger C2H2-type [Trinorchestia longiramus]